MNNIYNYIVIEGNIGAGKTSLARKIADDLSAKLVLEEFEENSFLPRFYKEPDRYAFPLELTFLAERFQQMRDTLNSRDMFQPMIISDYHFTKSLIFSRKTLQSDEYKLYCKLFEIINQSIPKPDLFVYLFSDIKKLQTNIKKRGRAYEMDITDEYLQSIQESYFEYMNQQVNSRILIVDVTDMDFVNNPLDYSMIKDWILREYPMGITKILR